MPIDPALLIRRQPPPPPKPDRGRWVTAGIFFGGTVFFGLFFLMALGDAGLTRGFFVCTAVLAVGALAVLVHSVWQDEGLMGLLIVWDWPIASNSFWKDWSWRVFAVIWLVLLSGVLCGVLMAKAPGAVPAAWLGGSRRSGP